MPCPVRKLARCDIGESHGGQLSYQSRRQARRSRVPRPAFRTSPHSTLAPATGLFNKAVIGRLLRFFAFTAVGNRMPPVSDRTRNKLAEINYRMVSTVS